MDKLKVVKIYNNKEPYVLKVLTGKEIVRPLLYTMEDKDRNQSQSEIPRCCGNIANEALGFLNGGKNNIGISGYSRRLREQSQGVWGWCGEFQKYLGACLTTGIRILIKSFFRNAEKRKRRNGGKSCDLEFLMWRNHRWCKGSN